MAALHCSYATSRRGLETAARSVDSPMATTGVMSGASERLLVFSSTSDLLRTLLLHVGKGYSLRETAVRAKAAGIAEVSDVALMKRLQKAEAWLRGLCVALLEESGWEMPAETRGFNVRALDGTLVKEPGRWG